MILIGLLSCAACEETSDWNKWINTRRSLAAGKSIYSTANCNCHAGVCTSSPPMCCSGLSLCHGPVSRCCDHQTDADNCGRCDNKCHGGSCSAGECVSKQGDTIVLVASSLEHIFLARFDQQVIIYRHRRRQRHRHRQRQRQQREQQITAQNDNSTSMSEMPR